MHRKAIRLALAAAAAALTVPASAGAAAAPAGFAGIYSENSHVETARGLQTLGDQVQAGATVLREPFDWNRVETSPGHYDWSRYDALVREAARRNVTLLPILWSPPAFRSSRPSRRAQRGMYPPRDFEDLARFAAAAVRRYGPGGTLWCKRSSMFNMDWGKPRCPAPYKPITAWQVWNEPDYPSFWPTGPDPAGYARLLRTVSRAIKAADPNAEVVAAGFSIHAFEKGYVQRFYAAGAAADFDTLALHPYAASVGKMLHHIRRLRAIAQAAGDSAPIWITEYGWATGGRSAVRHVVSERCQAALIDVATRALIERRGELGLRGIVQFMWNDRRTNTSHWPFYAGLLRPDGTSKPALQAFSDALRGIALPSSRGVQAVCPQRSQRLS